MPVSSSMSKYTHCVQPTSFISPHALQFAFEHTGCFIIGMRPTLCACTSHSHTQRKCALCVFLHSTAQHSYLHIMSEAHCVDVHCKVSHGACINLAAPQLGQSAQHAWVATSYYCHIHKLHCQNTIVCSVLQHALFLLLLL